MYLFLRFAYLSWFYYALLFLLSIIFFRQYYVRNSLYTFPLISYLSARHVAVSQLPLYILYALRLSALLFLVFLVGKPQIIDQKSKVTVEGIDIMMVLDISGSMTFFDDMQDQRMRISIAKDEGVRFVEKRHNDAIGLVVFGSYAMMRCPLTPDKIMLKSMIESISMNSGDPIHEGTVISQAVITAARHLQKSKAASKIIILLTDGEPSDKDFPIEEAITIAKSFGIKVYAIGIGNNGFAMQNHPLFGIMQYPHHFDTTLLKNLAEKTGGIFYDAKKIKDLAKIYDEIDTLEKSKYQDNVYTKYHDVFIPWLWLLLLLIISELIISTFVWTIL